MIMRGIILKLLWMRFLEGLILLQMLFGRKNMLLQMIIKLLLQCMTICLFIEKVKNGKEIFFREPSKKINSIGLKTP